MAKTKKAKAKKFRVMIGLEIEADSLDEACCRGEFFTHEPPLNACGPTWVSALGREVRSVNVPPRFKRARKDRHDHDRDAAHDHAAVTSTKEDVKTRISVNVNPGNTNSRILTGNAPSGRKIEVRTSVIGDLGRPGKMMPATVGWHAVGLVSPDDADAFADTIKHAAKIARELDEANGLEQGRKKP